MDCPQAKALIDAYVDGELDARSIMEFEPHLKSCPSCARIAENRRTLGAALRSADLSYAAPGDLRRRLRAATAPAEPAAWLQWRPMALAASFAAAVLIASAGGRHWRSSRADDAIASEIVSGHVRSLEASHLTDVLSSDRHTVKPWFAGKLDYSPSVEDLAADGFPLIGGRLDYADGRPVAALVYRRAAHTINLFAWPSSADAAERAGSQRGFNTLHWSRGGMTYWAVSDLNSGELSQFAALLRARE
jgi:anti-sigma factor RsiW